MTYVVSLCGASPRKKLGSLREGTVASVDLSNPAGVFGSLPASNWSLLVPAVGTTTWALPIFFNLLLGVARWVVWDVADP